MGRKVPEKESSVLFVCGDRGVCPAEAPGGGSFGQSDSSSARVQRPLAAMSIMLGGDLQDTACVHDMSLTDVHLLERDLFFREGPSRGQPGKLHHLLFWSYRNSYFERNDLVSFLTPCVC